MSIKELLLANGYDNYGCGWGSVISAHKVVGDKQLMYYGLSRSSHCIQCSYEDALGVIHTLSITIFSPEKELTQEKLKELEEKVL
jgi:hypothetical protein